VDVVLEHKDSTYLTLVTCEDYNTQGGMYSFLRKVRAMFIGFE
jgi:hypothetical protein